MLHYKVNNLDQFFSIYEFDEEEQREIRERFEAGDELYVRQDGSVFWKEDILEREPGAELVRDDDFRQEAEMCESVATLSDLEGEEDRSLIS